MSFPCPCVSAFGVQSVPFLLGLLLLAGTVGCSSGDDGSGDDGSSPDGLRVYVGTGSGDPDEGIYTFRFDATAGTLTQTQDVAPLLNPTYLAMGRDGEHLYSVRETTDSATVHAFDVDPGTGALTEINAVPAEGGAPCYVSLDETGRWVFVANYVGGNVAVFPVRDDGGLGPAAQVVQHTGSGADPDRQSGPHVHSVLPDPQNRYVLAADLGTDEVRVYPFDAETGRLDTAGVRPVSTPPGTGPRHLAFHPSGDYVYLVAELNGTVTTYEYDAEEGRMTAVQTLSTVPEDFDGFARSADVHVHPSGRYLYASNRGDANDIVAYRIDEATGRLTEVDRQAASISWPRNFALSPDGEYLLAANRRADSVTIFRVDPDTGALTDTGASVSVPEPTKVEFVETGGA
jgi:6-phosphogluconolactonase